jgi:hypothetical protein
MEIVSPPYPKNSTSPKDLYQALCELYAWTAEHRDWANMEANRLDAPESPWIPEMGSVPMPKDVSKFINLSVPDMFMSWQILRQIRERYDDVVRNYESESDWQSNACIFHRINILRMASLLLSVAFLNSEQREAKDHEFKVKASREFLKKVKKAFQEINNFQKGESYENTEIDFDNLFNSNNDED